MSTSAALSKTPLARVKDEFGGKDKLVDKIVGVLETNEDESKDELRKRLLGVSNTKLIRLHGVATRTKQAGGHDKLVTSAAERMKHGKDKDYVQMLSGLSNGRLLDIVQAAEGRSSGAAVAKPTTPAAVAAAHAERKATRKAKVQKAAPPKKAAAKPTARSKKSAVAKSKKRR